MTASGPPASNPPDRQAPGRSAAALAPLALIGYSLWRAGKQITAGLDPNFTVNAWGSALRSARRVRAVSR